MNEGEGADARGAGKILKKSRWRKGSAARCLPKDFCVLLQ